MTEQPKRHKVMGGHAASPTGERTDAFSDAVLQSSDGLTFPVHRLVLLSASAYFKALYQGGGAGMRETGRPLELANVDGHTLEAVLDFVYTGECSTSAPEALLEAADFLQIAPLRDAAAKVILADMEARASARSLCLFTWHTAERRAAHYSERIPDLAAGFSAVQEACIATVRLHFAAVATTGE